MKGAKVALVRGPARVLLVLIMLLAGSVSASRGARATRASLPGELDLSYGGGTGKSLADFGGADVGIHLTLQPDGKIVVVGYTTANGTFDFGVARLLVPGGTFDPSYGGGTGRSIADLGGLDIANAVALQPDGKIVVAGESNANFAVARLLVPEGTFDPSYGGGSGTSFVNFGGADCGNGLALQPDGKIVVAGESSGNFAVVRILVPEGTLVPSYNGGHESIADFGGFDDIGHAVALEPDGKIVVAGESGGNFAVARLLVPQGSLDPSFGGGTGKSIADFGGFDIGWEVALQPDGKIVVAGSSNANGTDDFAVVRLLGDPVVTGPDPPTCAGKPATIIGTQAADALTGTPQSDVIVGFGGKDSIRGNGGSDIVCAGPGTDQLQGGPGSDVQQQ